MHGALSRMAKHKLAELEQLSAAFVNGMASIRLLPSASGKRGQDKAPRWQEVATPPGGQPDA